jgi:hypothetical protein
MGRFIGEAGGAGGSSSTEWKKESFTRTNLIRAGVSEVGCFTNFGKKGKLSVAVHAA